MEQVQSDLMEKAEWSVEYKEYTEADIRYMLFFFRALNEMHGYGKDRLTRVKDLMNQTIEEYQKNKEALQRWKIDLLDAGIYFENPIDPLTQEKSSMMCGGYE